MIILGRGSSQTRPHPGIPASNKICRVSLRRRVFSLFDRRIDIVEVDQITEDDDDVRTNNIEKGRQRRRNKKREKQKTEKRYKIYKKS